MRQILVGRFCEPLGSSEHPVQETLVAVMPSRSGKSIAERMLLVRCSLRAPGREDQRKTSATSVQRPVLENAQGTHLGWRRTRLGDTV